MKPIPFIGPAYQSRSENYSSQRCINLMLEPGKGKAPAMLVGTPGFTAPVVTLPGSGGVRGAFKIDEDTAIFVQGPTVYKVNAAYTATSLGTVTDDSRPAQIAWNGNNLLVTSAGSLYSLTLGGSSATLIASGIGMVDSIGDFFVATRTGTNFFIWSDAQPEPTTDPLNFDALNFKSTNFAADTMVGCKVSRSAVYFLGTKSIEPWYISGGADIPFSRIDGGAFKIGCLAKDSIAEMDGLFWLAGDDRGAGEVWSIAGGQPEKISTPAIDFMISQWPDKTDAEAFTYKDGGHAFYVLSSTSGNETWVYDITTKEWHQRASLVGSELSRIRPRCSVYFGGKLLVGDYVNGNLYEYSTSTYAENGQALPAIRSCATLQSGLEEQPTGSFALDMDVGVGLESGDTPQVSLRTSKNGGKTWSNELVRSIGKVGEYDKRVIWNRVGGGRKVVFEVTITDPVQRNITGAFFS